MHDVLRFTDTLAQRLEYSGRKGANLANLTQQGFPIPTGFIVTTEAYRQFIAPEQRLLSAVAQWNFGLPEVIRKRSAELRNSLAALSLPYSLVVAVTQALSLYAADQAFAVRASPIVDDIAGAAFAGKYTSYLNCHGVDAVLQHIKNCFLSLWEDRALTYRNHNHLHQQDVAIAVVVQQMLHTEVSGVGFSVNPINGELQQIVINANYGVGHRADAPVHEVDQWVLHKPSGEILSAHISKKTLQHIATTQEGTFEEVLPDSQANMPCLTPHQLHNLNQLLIQVETHQGFPQEIEWGSCGGQFYCLQTRAITTLPPRWTRDEACARFPNAMTPLAWDFINPIFHESLHYSFALMNYPAFQGQWLDVHDHYVYGNQNAVEIYAQRLPLNIQNLSTLKEQFPLLYKNFHWMQELPSQWLYNLDNYLVDIHSVLIEPLGEKNLTELWKFITRISTLGHQHFRQNLAISLTQDLLQQSLLHLLNCQFGRVESLQVFDQLLGNLETKSQRIEQQLSQLAHYLRQQPELSLLLQQTDSCEIIARELLEDFPKFSQQFKLVLQEHGHCEWDFDLYHPTWSEAPWRVLDDLRLRLQTVMSAPVSPTQALHAEQQLLTQLPQELHFFFHELIRLTQLYTRLSDLVHYQTTRWILPFRKAMLTLGQHLQQQAILPEARDVFFAHLLDLEDAIQRDSARVWTQLAETIKLEKQTYREDRAQIPTWTLGEHLYDPVRHEHFIGNADSAGMVEGEVFLVRTAEEFAHFPKGAILVARSTHSAWMAVFYNASAVITESGHTLSHAAITARQLRIPAVSGLHEVFNVLKTGMRVRVNGDTGTVEKL